MLEDEEFASKLPYPKEEPSLPKILSREDLKKLFDACANEKHRVMFRLIYSSGLRRRDLINLSLNDLETKDGMCRIRINKGKGSKDRYTVLSKNVLNKIKAYNKKNKPNDRYPMTDTQRPMPNDRIIKIKNQLPDVQSDSRELYN